VAQPLHDGGMIDEVPSHADAAATGVAYQAIAALG
jgi:hypothetical protein